MSYSGRTVRRMRTRIGLLALPKPMRSIIHDSRREQRLGLALNCYVSRDDVSYPPLTANLTPHPASVAPLADQTADRGEWGLGDRLDAG